MITSSCYSCILLLYPDLVVVAEHTPTFPVIVLIVQHVIELVVLLLLFGDNNG